MLHHQTVVLVLVLHHQTVVFVLVLHHQTVVLVFSITPPDSTAALVSFQWTVLG